MQQADRDRTTGGGQRTPRQGRRRATAGLAAACVAALLGACSPLSSEAKPDASAKNRPAPVAAEPVPTGKGSELAERADDFNGDGHPDLVLADLVKDDSHGDDAGIGIVYGSDGGLRPAARQLIAPGERAARVQGQLPATFDPEATCDLDQDGFTDLIVSTDPPYNGQGRPPVPLQLLFGSPQGLTGKAVVLKVPDRSRYGNDWPDQPVCGDFDGDDSTDLVLHATGGRLSFLHGPFTRQGAPEEAGKPLRSPGSVPTGPALDVNADGYDDLLVRAGGGGSRSGVVTGSATGPDATEVMLPAGSDVAFGEFGLGKGTDAAVASETGATALRYGLPVPDRATLPLKAVRLDSGDLDGDGYDELVLLGKDNSLRVVPGSARGLRADAAVDVPASGSGTRQLLAVADFDGDGLDDLVVRAYRSAGEDTVTVLGGTKDGLLAKKPVASFSTSEFLGASRAAGNG